jgi:hypothetical protein
MMEYSSTTYSEYLSRGLKEDLLISNASQGIEGIENRQEHPLHQLLIDALIDPNEDIQEPPICLELNQDNGPAIIGTLGNFSLIIGKAKSRKTFFITIALAAAVKNDYILNAFKGTLPSEKNVVLYFDTEQGRYHLLKAVRRIIKLSGYCNPVNLIPYGLRKFRPSERLQMIEYAIQNTPNLGFVVIDGVRDLVTSINDEILATDIASKLLKWTEEYNIHILCVLHQNKGDNNARGHLGSELQNKAESVISITKSSDRKDFSIVEPEYCRDKDFEPFAFSIDECGMPYIIDDWASNKQDASKTRSFMPGSLEPQQHKEILQAAFKLAKPTYQELVFRIKERLSVGDSKAKHFITWYKDNNYIEAVGRSGTKSCHYQLCKPM